MNQSVKVIFLFIFIINVVFTSEYKDKAFNKINFGLSFSNNINNDVLFDFYDFNNGFSTSIITPFYIGHAKAHLNISSFKGKEYPFVNFRNISSDLFWLNEKEILLKLYIEYGLGFGLNIFSFQSNDKCVETSGFKCDENFNLLNLTYVTETELSYSLFLGFSYPVNKRLSIKSEFYIERILTFREINLINPSLGVYYELKSPYWFKTFLE